MVNFLLVINILKKEGGFGLVYADSAGDTTFDGNRLVRYNLRICSIARYSFLRLENGTDKL